MRNTSRALLAKLLIGNFALVGCSSSKKPTDPPPPAPTKVSEAQLASPTPISIPPTTQPEVSPAAEVTPPPPPIPAALPEPSHELPAPQEKKDDLAVSLKPTGDGKTFRYRVQPGDTLWSIAERFLGDGNRFQELQEQNNIANPLKLEKNTEVKLVPKMNKDKTPHAQGDLAE